MPKIIYIKEGVTKGRVLIGIDNDGDSAAYSVTKSTYIAIGSPVRYTVIDERDFYSIAAEDERYRAMKKAVSSIAVSDKSAHTLKSKLLMAGFSHEATDEAIGECIARGYIDEERQLIRLVEREANGSLRGRYYIKRKLAAKGYRLSDIDKVINNLVGSQTVDFKKNFESLAEKKGASDDESRRALAYKFGYKI